MLEWDGASGSEPDGDVDADDLAWLGYGPNPPRKGDAG